MCLPPTSLSSDFVCPFSSAVYSFSMLSLVLTLIKRRHLPSLLTGTRGMSGWGFWALYMDQGLGGNCRDHAFPPLSLPSVPRSYQPCPGPDVHCQLYLLSLASQTLNSSWMGGGERLC